MPLTFIDTSKLPKRPSAGHGEVTEVLSEALCGARNVQGSLRRLAPGESFEAKPLERHQLIYLMEGAGRIRLGNQDVAVEKGAGVYLGPSETATIAASQSAAVKLFHLVVPRIPA
jgi:hypothetical protein